MKKNYLLKKVSRGSLFLGLCSAMIFSVLLFTIPNAHAQNDSPGWTTIAAWTDFSTLNVTSSIFSGSSATANADCGTGTFSCNKSTSTSTSNLGAQVCGSSNNKNIYIDNSDDDNELIFSVTGDVSQYQSFKFSFVNKVEDYDGSTFDRSYISSLSVFYSFDGTNWGSLSSSWATSESNKSFSGTITNTSHANGNIYFKIQYVAFGTLFTSTKAYFDNISIEGEKDIKTITYHISPSEAATSIGAGTFEYGKTCSLNYNNVNPHFRFVNWTCGNTSSTATLYIFTVTEDLTITANFERKKYIIDYPSNPTTYTLSFSSGLIGTQSDSVTSGIPVLFTVTPKTGYTQHTPEVRINGMDLAPLTLGGNQYSYTPSSDTYITIAELNPNSYTISASLNPSGIALINGGGFFNHFDTCRFFITNINACYHFVNWTENSTVVSTSENYKFEATKDRTLKANFAQNKYRVDFDINTACILSEVSGLTNDSITCGRIFSFKITPTTPFTQRTPIVTMNNSPLTATSITGGVYYYSVSNVRENIIIKSDTLDLNEYNITVNSNSHPEFTISPTPTTAKHGSDFVFGIDLTDTYDNSDIVVTCGVTTLTPNENAKYTIGNVIKDTTVAVTCLYANEYDTLLLHTDTILRYSGITYNENGYIKDAISTGETYYIKKNDNVCKKVLELAVITVENPADTILYFTNNGIDCPNIDIPRITTTPNITPDSVKANLTSYEFSIYDLEKEFNVTYTLYYGTQSIKCYNKVTVIRMHCGGYYKAEDADGTLYNTVFVGGKCWLKENLKYRGNLTAPSILAYNYDVSNVNQYGYLYTWYAAVGLEENSIFSPVLYDDTYQSNLIQGICPNGWYLPNRADIDALNLASGDLRSNAAEYWLTPIASTDPNGFDMVPSGYYDPSTGTFVDMMIMGYMWSTETIATHSTCYTCPFGCNPFDVLTFSKNTNMSVRCVKDGSTTGLIDTHN